MYFYHHVGYFIILVFVEYNIILSLFIIDLFLYRQTAAAVDDIKKVDKKKKEEIM